MGYRANISIILNMTVRESLLEKGKKYYNSQVKRLERLKEISAPQIVIENITKELSVGDEEYANNFLNKINIKKCPTGVLDFEIINEERKIGRGGKPYYYMQTNNGEFNFFPLAQYGAVLFPNEKNKTMNTKTIKSKLDKLSLEADDNEIIREIDFTLRQLSSQFNVTRAYGLNYKVQKEIILEELNHMEKFYLETIERARMLLNQL